MKKLKPRKFTGLRIEVTAFNKRDGLMCAVLEATPHDFKSGSKGFHGQRKIENHTTGERYQVNVTAVLIGSKPKKKAVKKK